jgi:hypothetical protein
MDGRRTVPRGRQLIGCSVFPGASVEDKKKPAEITRLAERRLRDRGDSLKPLKWSEVGTLYAGKPQ